MHELLADCLAWLVCEGLMLLPRYRVVEFAETHGLMAAAWSFWPGRPGGPCTMKACRLIRQHVWAQVFDRITPKAMRPLQKTNRVVRSVTTSDDPVIRHASASYIARAAAAAAAAMATHHPASPLVPVHCSLRWCACSSAWPHPGQGGCRLHTHRIQATDAHAACVLCRRLAGEDKARVFATDTVLTTLMCAARSVYSWDVVVTRAGEPGLAAQEGGGCNLHGGAGAAAAGL